MEKKILKKLVIKKEPISNLTDGNLKQQIGGRFITSWFACPTWLQCCSDTCGGYDGEPGWGYGPWSENGEVQYSCNGLTGGMPTC